MRLKRQYDPAELKEWNDAGRPADQAPKATHVTVQRTSKIQRFNPGFLDQQTAAGLVSIAGGKVSFKTAEGQPDLVFRIVASPGLYCCHCGVRLSDSNTAKDHVGDLHAGVPSPDVKPCGAGISGNPAGYRQDNFFTCELEG